MIYRHSLTAWVFRLLVIVFAVGCYLFKVPQLGVAVAGVTLLVAQFRQSLEVVLLVGVIGLWLALVGAATWAGLDYVSYVVFATIVAETLLVDRYDLRTLYASLLGGE